jgi:hypothetical protein
VPARRGRVHFVEHVIDPGEDRVNHEPDLADRMIGRDQVLGDTEVGIPI